MTTKSPLFADDSGQLILLIVVLVCYLRQRQLVGFLLAVVGVPSLFGLFISFIEPYTSAR